VQFDNLGIHSPPPTKRASCQAGQLHRGGESGGVIAASPTTTPGLAYHSRRLGIPVTIVMPRGTPFVKGQQTHAHGRGGDRGDGYYDSPGPSRLCAERDLVFVQTAFNDLDVMASRAGGAGDAGGTPRLEILPVPIGGGGLIAGMARGKHVNRRSRSSAWIRPCTLLHRPDARRERRRRQRRGEPSSEASGQAGGRLELCAVALPLVERGAADQERSSSAPCRTAMSRRP